MKKHLTTAVIMTAIVFAAGAALPCLAIDLSTTEITNINGRVEVKKTADALFKKLNNNLKLAGALKRLDSGDKVRTYDKSAAEMSLKETCILAVKEQSIFEVPQTLGQDAIKELTAQQGTILFKVITGSNFQVQTADVIAGVKGTLFELDIVDNFVAMLETPALQIGTVAPGATNINVYKGEVELTHKNTGKKRSLKAGEGLAALSSSLMKIDNIFSEGFTPLRKFDPSSMLSQNFGSGVSSLLNAEASLSALANVKGLGNFKSNLGANRLLGMFGDVSDKIKKAVSRLEGVRQNFGELSEYWEDGKTVFGPGFKADFSKYQPEKRSFMVTDNRFKEVYLGNNAFAACKASAGAKTAKFEPNQEGIQLTEGNASFRVRRYKNIESDVEFIASHYLADNQLITTIKVLKGDLYGRTPGTLEHFKIPAGEMSYVYGINNGKGNWMQAAAGAIDTDLNSYTFKAEEKIARDKAKYDKEADKKKKEVGKKVGKKLLEKVKIKGLW